MCVIRVFLEGAKIVLENIVRLPQTRCFNKSVTIPYIWRQISTLLLLNSASMGVLKTLQIFPFDLTLSTPRRPHRQISMRPRIYPSLTRVASESRSLNVSIWIQWRRHGAIQANVYAVAQCILQGSRGYFLAHSSRLALCAVGNDVMEVLLEWDGWEWCCICYFGSEAVLFESGFRDTEGNVRGLIGNKGFLRIEVEFGLHRLILIVYVVSCSTHVPTTSPNRRQLTTEVNAWHEPRSFGM